MKISVVVPVRNEEDSIRELLDGLLSQTRAPDEIVITDGGSTDATPSIIDDYVKRDAPVRLIRERAALPGRGRNVGAENAANEWIAFIDAGTKPERDWLEELARRAERKPAVDVVYGAWEPITDSFFKECAAIAYVPSPVEVEGEQMRPRFIGSSLMRRDIWRKAGGFPEHLRSAEDILFMERVAKITFRVAYAPRALVRWNIQPNFRRTFKRFANYSRHNIRAGLWREWQSAIFSRYALLALVALPALLFGRWWLLVTLALWLLMLAARAATAIQRNHHSYPATLTRNLARLLLLMPIIATLDAAAFAGTLNWLIKDKLHLGNAPQEVSG
ncbi:MAG: glycosyltransferase [Pyrinomonadaceae bacterium]